MKKNQPLLKRAMMFAVLAELILVFLFFTLGHIQAASFDRGSNLLGLLAVWFHFLAFYIFGALHFWLDADTFIPFLIVAMIIGAVQWFLISLCYLLISRRFHKHDAA